MTLLDHVAVIGLLFLGVLAVAFARWISRLAERIRAAAWSLLGKSPPDEDKLPSEARQRTSDFSS